VTLSFVTSGMLCSKLGTSLLTERLVTEWNWCKSRAGHFRIDIY